VNILEIKDLKIYYETLQGVVKAVDGIDFIVKKGTSVGLAGESGCGKTTLGLSLLKLLPENGTIQGGSVHFEEQDIYSLSEDESLGKMFAGRRSLWSFKVQ